MYNGKYTIDLIFNTLDVAVTFTYENDKGDLITPPYQSLDIDKVMLDAIDITNFIFESELENKLIEQIINYGII